MMKRFFALWAALLCCLLSSAKITLPSLVGDGMVLQRDAAVRIWGSSDRPKVTLTTSWDGKKYAARVDASGQWCVEVRTPVSGGGPYTVTLSDGDERILLRDVLVGEVWICSGQSNMEMPLGGWEHQRVENAYETILDADSTPLVRMFTVARNNADTPQEDCRGAWKSSTPDALKSFSATAYHFGKTLSRFMKDMPIGLIATDWGGTPIEAWLSVEALEKTPGIDLALSKSLYWEEVHTGQLFNGMIYPLRKYAARGFIWYQGEANLVNAGDYAALTEAMVQEWRALWGNPDMPYYLVQIAPYNYDDPDGIGLPLLVEQQYRIPERLPHSGVAATTDIGHRDCIHPPFKKEVGERLAYLALANDYGFEGLPVTPRYKEMEKEGSALRLRFVNGPSAGDGFRIHGSQRKLELGGFEIAGADRRWHPAEAQIVWGKSEILVSSPEVSDPVAARYAFHNWPEGANVLTDSGLPLPMFRTDDWAPGPKRDTLRILAIGNSFSEDAIENNLWELLHEAGIPAVVANLYIGGCTLERHYRNSVADAPEYRYRKVVDGKKLERYGVSLSEALAEEDWTHVSFQQASGVSGIYATYDPYLEELIKYVKGFVPAETTFLFHQTWAYSADAAHPEFPAYGRDQMNMYQCILRAVTSALKDHPEITLLVPSGTAIQNARTSSLGDTLNRDGYHLDYQYGRFAAACTWFAALTGLRASDNPWKPQSVDESTAAICRQAADLAVKRPFAVTPVNE
jgi:sialate O-acetylesterase